MANFCSRYESCQETTNFARICRIVVDVLRDILWQVLIHEISPDDLPKRVQTNQNNLRNLNVKIKTWLCGISSSSSEIPVGEKFDVSSLYVLIRNLCSQVPAPSTRWGKPPPPSGTTLGDDIERVREFRNTLYGHATMAKIKTADFNRLWRSIKNVVSRFDLYFGSNCKAMKCDFQMEIVHILTCSMDNSLQDAYINKMKEITMLSDDLKKVKQQVGSVKQEVDDVNHQVEDLKQEFINVKQQVGDVELDVGNLRLEVGHVKQILQDKVHIVKKDNAEVKGINLEPDVSKKGNFFRQASKCYLHALHDYDASGKEDSISLKKGDILELIDDSDSDWWLARHIGPGNISTCIEGYVPRNFVLVEDSLESQEWFVGKIKRKEAEQMMLAAGQQPGSFLVRKSETYSGKYVLSVRDHDPNKRDCIRHYIISSMKNGDYCIDNGKKFRRLIDLVDHYKAQAHGLCKALTIPCPKPKPVIDDFCRETIAAQQIPRDSLKFVVKPGAGQFGEVWKDNAEVKGIHLEPDVSKKGNFFRQASKCYLHALHDYDASGNEDSINLKKGDILELIDDSDSDWWLARHIGPGNISICIEGYVPRNYVLVEDSLKFQEWFVGKIKRKEAEQMMLAAGQQPGSFLIRKSETYSGKYVLSVRDHDPNKGDCIRHYVISSMKNGDYCIDNGKKFRRLIDLVDHYKAQADGLCKVLTIPCPKPKPVIDDFCRETIADWEIPRDSLKFVVKLGAGQFGEVWKGKWNKITNVAIKTLKPGIMSPEDFLREAMIMKKCRHEKLVRLYAVCSQVEPICIITELMSEGSLLHCLREDVERNITLVVMVDMAAQIASGMAYLEQNKLIHRDLAARNIMVGKNNIVKVADFGLAIEDDEKNPKQRIKLPTKWTAPEAALLCKFSIKSDVWSYGILLMEIITKGAVPYPGMKNQEAIKQVDHGYRMPKPSNCPDSMYEVMLKCWDRMAGNRPTFEFLFAFFDDYFIYADSNYCNCDEFCIENDHSYLKCQKI